MGFSGGGLVLLKSLCASSLASLGGGRSNLAGACQPLTAGTGGPGNEISDGSVFRIVRAGTGIRAESRREGDEADDDDDE